MKKYVLKSVIVFTMILILGLILIPMIPTEKEVIESDLSFDLIFEKNVVFYYHDNDFDFSSYGYNIYFYQFVDSDNNEIQSNLFNVDNGIMSDSNVKIDSINKELEIDNSGYFILWGVSK